MGCKRIHELVQMYVRNSEHMQKNYETALHILDFSKEEGNSNITAAHQGPIRAQSEHSSLSLTTQQPESWYWKCISQKMVKQLMRMGKFQSSGSGQNL